MAVSNDPARTGSSRVFPATFDGLSRYDLVLALVPLAFALTLSVHVLVGISLQLAVAGGAVLGLAVLVDALFVNPPSESPPRSSP